MQRAGGLALAVRCEIAERHDLDRWLVASAYEALARASAVAGDRGTATAWKARAQATIAEVDDPDDRQVVEGDIATLPV